MAPPPSQSTDQAKPAAKDHSFQSWLANYGQEEFEMYKRTAAHPHLTYQDWASSENPLGAYLYRLTLDAWVSKASSVSFNMANFLTRLVASD